ncbi:hypothetical protein TrCOL_g7270 [Triparma columacea]|uniref:carnosine N-methyltransferase n=1 Tax=Triparma columacea TaxID=722753 RepID=A0A9W7LG95_9STRA|nr:hypothetical protein TrCOL_g7270 [Triparma columacea]
MRSPDDAMEEQLHMDRVCNAYGQYSMFQQALRRSLRKRLDNCSERSKKFFPKGLLSASQEALEREKEDREAESRNQAFLDAVMMHANQPTSRDQLEYKKSLGNRYVFESDNDHSKIQSVLKSCVRDWSVEGAREREQCYSPIINACEKYVRGGGRVLVPGSGLGRLALELAGKNFAVQGNDFSLHMLFASDYLLNASGGAGATHELSPYLGSTVNRNRVKDCVKKYKIPDVDPQRLLCGDGEVPMGGGADFSMAGGEFLDIYAKKEEHGKWSGVASCFFIDTAVNIVDYFLCIWDMLEPGGYLINLGPLLYHWSGPNMRPDESQLGQHSGRMDTRYLQSIDVCWEDVREIMQNVGFEIVEETTGLDCQYTRDEDSFMFTSYRCVFFVARKPLS